MNLAVFAKTSIINLKVFQSRLGDSKLLSYDFVKNKFHILKK